LKPIILVFARYYLPGYRAGGPIRTLANMVEQLGDEFEFRIVTQDRDHDDRVAYPGIKTETWLPIGSGYVYYLPWGAFSFWKIISLLRTVRHDLVYHNSFFNPIFTIQYLIARRLMFVPKRPVVIAPRGEFSEGALEIKKAKKSLFIQVAKLAGVYNNMYWQASSNFEADDIRKIMNIGGTKGAVGWIRTTGNLVIAPDLLSGATDFSRKAVRGLRPHLPFRICFLSRVCEIKNLEFVLRVLVHVRKPVQLRIYGPTEDAIYWKKCEAIIDILPGNVDAKYFGTVIPEDVRNIMSENDLFFLPTRGENFGHVIFEALCAKLPLLISDRTPWRNLAYHGLGWDLPLSDPNLFAQRIEEMVDWAPEKYIEFEGNVECYLKAILNSNVSVEANRRLFFDALEID
jgi:glycosyltransferase involved in cell wall biosynthesis